MSLFGKVYRFIGRIETRMTTNHWIKNHLGLCETKIYSASDANTIMKELIHSLCKNAFLSNNNQSKQKELLRELVNISAGSNNFRSITHILSVAHGMDKFGFKDLVDQSISNNSFNMIVRQFCLEREDAEQYERTERIKEINHILNVLVKERA